MAGGGVGPRRGYRLRRTEWKLRSMVRISARTTRQLPDVLTAVTKAHTFSRDEDRALLLNRVEHNKRRIIKNNKRRLDAIQES